MWSQSRNPRIFGVACRTLKGKKIDQFGELSVNRRSLSIYAPGRFGQYRLPPHSSCRYTCSCRSHHNPVRETQDADLTVFTVRNILDNGAIQSNGR